MRDLDRLTAGVEIATLKLKKAREELATAEEVARAKVKAAEANLERAVAFLELRKSQAARADAIVSAYAEGKTPAQIGRLFGASFAAVQSAIARTGRRKELRDSAKSVRSAEKAGKI